MPKFTTVIPASGPDGNIFAVLGNACRLLRQLNIANAEITALTERVTSSSSYAEALAHIRVYFPVDPGEG